MLETVCGAVRRLLKILNCAFEWNYYYYYYYYTHHGRQTETVTPRQKETEKVKEAQRMAETVKERQTDEGRQGWLVGCLTSQQHARVSQGRICTDNFTCCHTEVADQTFHLTQSQYTDTRPTSPSADPITPGAWQGGHWSANV